LLAALVAARAAGGRAAAAALESRKAKASRRPPLAWNTWCTSSTCFQEHEEKKLHDVCSEEEIKTIAEAIITNGMRDIGYRYINLDDCWCATERDHRGDLVGDRERFPNGIAALSQWLHNRGFLFGIYLSAGVTTCSRGGRAADIPGSYGNYVRDANRMNEWNVDYVKLDWCGHILPNGTKLQQSVQTVQFNEALRAANSEIWFNFHCDEGEPGFQGHAWCIQSGDSFRVWHDHHDTWPSTYSIIKNAWMNNDVMKQGGPHHWNDGDFLMTGGAGCGKKTPGLRCPGMTDDEYRTEMALWCVSSSAIVVSTDVRQMSDLQKQILLSKDALAVNQLFVGDSGRYIGAVGDQLQLFVKQLRSGSSNGNYTMWAVVVLNEAATATTAAVTVDFAKVNAAFANATAVVFDVWAETAVVRRASFTSAGPIAPHGTSFVILSQTDATTTTTTTWQPLPPQHRPWLHDYDALLLPAVQ